MSNPIDRAGLIRVANRYLDAVATHDMRAASLARNYRGTENTLDVAPGDSLWRSARDFPSRQFFADELSGQVVAMGAVRIGDALKPYMIRLRAEGAAVIESEAIISGDSRGHFADVDQLLRPDVLYDAPIPPERACNRDQLREVADSYWIALENSDGSMARFNYRCDRFANGKKITSNLSILLSPDAAVHSCASCLYATRPARPRIRERRFPVLDLERGVAASIVLAEFLPPPGNTRPDIGAFYMLGVFKVVDGEFRIIDEIHEIMALGTRSGW